MRGTFFERSKGRLLKLYNGGLEGIELGPRILVEIERARIVWAEHVLRMNTTRVAKKCSKKKSGI